MKSLFFCTLGLQAGGSVLHLCVIINLAMFVDEVAFLEIYPQFSAQINLIFLIRDCREQLLKSTPRDVHGRIRAHVGVGMPTLSKSHLSA